VLTGLAPLRADTPTVDVDFPGAERAIVAGGCPPHRQRALRAATRACVRGGYTRSITTAATPGASDGVAAFGAAGTAG
jgi:hypothetical protein